MTTQERIAALEKTMSESIELPSHGKLKAGDVIALNERRLLRLDASVREIVALLKDIAASD